MMSRSTFAVLSCALAVTLLLSPSLEATNGQLNGDETLEAGQFMFSPEGEYMLWVNTGPPQLPGTYFVSWLNYVQSELLWASWADFPEVFGSGHGAQSVGGDSGSYLIMQLDGNAVFYDGDETPLWDTGTGGNSGARLNLQDDGNLVVVTSEEVPIWSVF